MIIATKERRPDLEVSSKEVREVLSRIDAERAQSTENAGGATCGATAAAHDALPADLLILTFGGMDTSGAWFDDCQVYCPGR